MREILKRESLMRTTLMRVHANYWGSGGLLRVMSGGRCARRRTPINSLRMERPPRRPSKSDPGRSCALAGLAPIHSTLHGTEILAP